VRNVYFSPKNTYLVSYAHRRHTDKHGNCWLWQWAAPSSGPPESKESAADSADGAKPGKVVYRFFVAEFDKKRVPLQFTDDGFVAARVQRNAVVVHDAQRLHFASNNILGKIDVANAAAVVVAPTQRRPTPQRSYLLAVFALPKAQKAATVTIYEFEFAAKKGGASAFTKLAQRAFFGADECDLLWSPSSGYHRNLLAVASSDVDASGKSYYGHQTLYLLSSRDSATVSVPIAEKGKLQDVAWHPRGREFAIIDDHPHKATLLDKKGNTVADLGRSARNLIRFSPGSGRFLWLGGFGNLTGEMAFYDYLALKDKNQRGKCLGYATDDACRYFEWSPDGGSFVTARLYPFMTVDNGFRLYRYNGKQIGDHKFERLYQVAFRPSAPKTYPDRSPSPKSKKASKPLPKAQEKKRYCPPHLRAQKGGTQPPGRNAAASSAAPRLHHQPQTPLPPQQRPQQQHQHQHQHQPQQQQYPQQLQYPQPQQYPPQQYPAQRYPAQRYPAQRYPAQQYPAHSGYHQGVPPQHQQQQHGHFGTAHHPPNDGVVAPVAVAAAAMGQSPQNAVSAVSGDNVDDGSNLKKKRRRRRKKAVSNGGVDGGGGGAEADAKNGNAAKKGNAFKPGLNDGKRWARGSKYEG